MYTLSTYRPEYRVKNYLYFVKPIIYIVALKSKKLQFRGQQNQNHNQTIRSSHRIKGFSSLILQINSLSICMHFISTGSELKILGIITARFCEEIFKLQVLI